MSDAADTQVLEWLSREAQVPLDTVITLYRRECDALAQDARITSYIPLLAARSVRHQLLNHPQWARSR